MEALVRISLAPGDLPECAEARRENFAASHRKGPAHPPCRIRNRPGALTFDRRESSGSPGGHLAGLTAGGGEHLKVTLLAAFQIAEIADIASNAPAQGHHVDRELVQLSLWSELLRTRKTKGRDRTVTFGAEVQAELQQWGAEAEAETKAKAHTLPRSSETGFPRERATSSARPSVFGSLPGFGSGNSNARWGWISFPSSQLACESFGSEIERTPSRVVRGFIAWKPPERGIWRRRTSSGAAETASIKSKIFVLSFERSSALPAPALPDIEAVSSAAAAVAADARGHRVKIRSGQLDSVKRVSRSLDGSESLPPTRFYGNDTLGLRAQLGLALPDGQSAAKAKARRATDPRVALNHPMRLPKRLLPSKTLLRRSCKRRNPPLRQKRRSDEFFVFQGRSCCSKLQYCVLAALMATEDAAGPHDSCDRLAALSAVNSAATDAAAALRAPAALMAAVQAAEEHITTASGELQDMGYVRHGTTQKPRKKVALLNMIGPECATLLQIQDFRKVVSGEGYFDVVIAKSVLFSEAQVRLLEGAAAAKDWRQARAELQSQMQAEEEMPEIEPRSPAMEVEVLSRVRTSLVIVEVDEEAFASRRRAFPDSSLEHTAGAMGFGLTYAGIEPILKVEWMPKICQALRCLATVPHGWAAGGCIEALVVMVPAEPDARSRGVFEEGAGLLEVYVLKDADRRLAARGGKAFLSVPLYPENPSLRLVAEGPGARASLQTSSENTEELIPAHALKAALDAASVEECETTRLADILTRPEALFASLTGSGDGKDVPGLTVADFQAAAQAAAGEELGELNARLAARLSREHEAQLQNARTALHEAGDALQQLAFDRAQQDCVGSLAARRAAAARRRDAAQLEAQEASHAEIAEARQRLELERIQRLEDFREQLVTALATLNSTELQETRRRLEALQAPMQTLQAVRQEPGQASPDGTSESQEKVPVPRKAQPSLAAKLLTLETEVAHSYGSPNYPSLSCHLLKPVICSGPVGLPLPAIPMACSHFETSDAARRAPNPMARSELPALPRLLGRAPATPATAKPALSSRSEKRRPFGRDDRAKLPGSRGSSRALSSRATSRGSAGVSDEEDAKESKEERGSRQPFQMWTRLRTRELMPMPHMEDILGIGPAVSFGHGLLWSGIFQQYAVGWLPGMSPSGSVTLGAAELGKLLRENHVNLDYASRCRVIELAGGRNAQSMDFLGFRRLVESTAKGAVFLEDLSATGLKTRKRPDEAALAVVRAVFNSYAEGKAEMEREDYMRLLRDRAQVPRSSEGMQDLQRQLAFCREDGLPGPLDLTAFMRFLAFLGSSGKR
ncbi:unnamed protein product [Effrenium voratum]|nr:unnamed protein product [Effrenium voratum]